MIPRPFIITGDYKHSEGSIGGCGTDGACGGGGGCNGVCGVGCTGGVLMVCTGGGTYVGSVRRDDGRGGTVVAVIVFAKLVVLVRVLLICPLVRLFVIVMCKMVVLEEVVVVIVCNQEILKILVIAGALRQ